MRQQRHPLKPSNSGTQRELVSLHYGPTGQGPKVYLQTALHADELPGMMVMHHLRHRLDACEAAGQLRGEVVLVPVANPLGLDQQLLHAHLGRFDLHSGENFNRHYPCLADEVFEQVQAKLGREAEQNRALVRQAVGARLAQQTPQTELASLRLHLLRLAHDADVVLDLHCDFEAVMHLYVEQPLVDNGAVEPLARWLGAEAVLWAKGSGAALCFDESLSSLWWRLAERVGAQTPVPLACLSSTVELRGQRDVGGDAARQDAQNLLHYLTHLGVIAGPALEPPAARCVPTPLAGVQTLRAPHAGVIDHHLSPGSPVRAGQTVATVVEPISNQTTAVCAEIDGLYFQRPIQRWATPHMDVGKIAGHTAFKTGELLTP